VEVGASPTPEFRVGKIERLAVIRFTSAEWIARRWELVDRRVAESERIDTGRSAGTTPRVVRSHRLYPPKRFPRFGGYVVGHLNIDASGVDSVFRDLDLLVLVSLAKYFKFSHCYLRIFGFIAPTLS